jgi:hypothetical protein
MYLVVINQGHAEISQDEILKLLKAKQYDKLESIFNDFQKEYEKDFSKEDLIITAFDAFKTKSLDEYLSEWISAKPKSAYALLARATYFMNTGWEHRGTKLAKDTSEAQFAKMEEYFEKSLRDINSSILLNPMITNGHVLLIRVCV